jgi:hypothetical protein
MDRSAAATLHHSRWHRNYSLAPRGSSRAATPALLALRIRVRDVTALRSRKSGRPPRRKAGFPETSAWLTAFHKFAAPVTCTPVPPNASYRLHRGDPDRKAEHDEQHNDRDLGDRRAFVLRLAHIGLQYALDTRVESRLLFGRPTHRSPATSEMRPAPVRHTISKTRRYGQRWRPGVSRCGVAKPRRSRLAHDPELQTGNQRHLRWQQSAQLPSLLQSLAGSPRNSRFALPFVTMSLN